MRHKRSAGEQVKSGFRIAGFMLLSFLVFVGLIGGFVLLTQNIEGPQLLRQALGSVLILSLDVFMFVTARYWSKWIFGFLAYGCFRLFGGILFGSHFSHPLDRETAVLWFLYAFAACALTARYLRRRPTSLERSGLVLFVSCIALSAAADSPKPLFVGLAALSICEFIQWILSQNKHRRTPEALNTLQLPK
jgi:hypothetical protein